MSTSPLDTCSGRWSRSYHRLYSSVHHAGMSSMASNIPLASIGSVRQLDGDGGAPRGQLGPALLLGPDIEVHNPFGALVAHGGDRASRRHGLTLGVGRPKLAVQTQDVAFVTDPLAQQVVQVGPLQV